jgi:hypothetical protein
LTFGIYYNSKSHIYQNYLVTEIFNVRRLARSRIAHEEERALQHASQVQIHQKRQYGSRMRLHYSSLVFGLYIATRVRATAGNI